MAIALQRVRQIGKSQRRRRCVSQSQNQVTHRLCLGHAISKARVAKSLVMIEGIVDRMIDSSLIVFAGIGELQRGDSQMLQERCEVRTRA